MRNILGKKFQTSMAFLRLIASHVRGMNLTSFLLTIEKTMWFQKWDITKIMKMSGMCRRLFMMKILSWLMWEIGLLIMILKCIQERWPRLQKAVRVTVMKACYPIGGNGWYPQRKFFIYKNENIVKKINPPTPCNSREICQFLNSILKGFWVFSFHTFIFLRFHLLQRISVECIFLCD